MRRSNDWKLGIIQLILSIHSVPHKGSLEIPGTPNFATVLGFKKWIYTTHYFYPKKLGTRKSNYCLSTKFTETLFASNPFVYPFQNLLMEAYRVLNLSPMLFTQQYRSSSGSKDRFDFDTPNQHSSS